MYASTVQMRGGGVNILKTMSVVTNDIRPCCEQSNKMCDSTIEACCVAMIKSTFVSDVNDVHGFMFSTPTNEDFTYAKNVFY